MEMTTQEIIEQLRKSNDEEALRELKDILQTADLVKFARLAPAMTERERSLLQAANYVRHTQLADSEVPKTEKRIVTRRTAHGNRNEPTASWPAR